jgi:predicted permease
MWIRIVEVIFPVFAVIALGYGYGRLKKPDMTFANQLNMQVFVPAIIFAALSSKSFEVERYGVLAVGAFIVIMGSGVIGWPLARLLGAEHKTVLPPLMFNNSGNMGLPLAILAFGEHALPAAVMMFFVSNISHYTVGTWLLNPRVRLIGLWKEPVIVASVLGILASLFHIEVWPPLHFAIKMTGDVSVPLLLFSLGVRLISADFSDLKLGVLVGLARPMIGLFLAALCLWLLPLSPEQAAMLVVFASLPPAVLNFVFAETYGQEPHRVASIVMIGNLMSLIFVPLALYWVL